MLAPNTWDPHQTLLEGPWGRPLPGVFSRPLSIGGSKTVHVKLCFSASKWTDEDSSERELIAFLEESLGEEEVGEVVRQVTRMLRISPEDNRREQEFRSLFPQAEQDHWFRLFRSPSMFEDACKTITLCNAGWGRTITMNQLLCEKVSSCGGFPTPLELSSWDPEDLKRECGVGYRAARLISLARRAVESEELEELEKLARRCRSPSVGEAQQGELRAKLLALEGFGPYATDNMLMLLGIYNNIAIDSETLRHLKSLHGVDEKSAARAVQKVSKIYDRYCPYQFLVYWRELWKDYERLCGPLHLLPSSRYSMLCANHMKKIRS
ncbi:hypothetical protein GUITHDRAFT_160483 [Guillardia theta CCMP2712]|uniref:HhH-GPD domain-containing protein n=2 Tax=Guillardia theta TaxID=55529 RepID=L1K4Y2_GUITC|nr:hypothetical protein GUITHDRAFT_160483 [Guillardia theta CCMP2712]EKX55520.1 hypothetical protein GUITHDRAFT_160483 [Guillardia theta CCMP2712]|eukprot:XP_005842500.1 hypothetical protein GUITHDRAFT_160483 [Guillardia theta CCMP2712]